MSLFRRLTLSILSLAAIVGTRALACNCSQPSIDQGLRRADAVFQGTVRNVSFIDPKNPVPQVVVEFDVSQVWKGHVTRQFEIYSKGEEFSCEASFQKIFVVGQELIIYASLSSPRFLGIYSTNICSRTSPLVDGKLDLRQLGEGHPPISGKNHTTLGFPAPNNGETRAP